MVGDGERPRLSFREEPAMVIGHHLIWTAYGWWLPNDPRGSSSHEIRVERIAELGELHHGRKRVQPPRAELREFFDEARGVLKHDVLTSTGEDVGIVGSSFAKNFSTSWRRSFRRSTTCSASSTPCSWKTLFDVSIPIRAILAMDGSLE